MRSARQHKHTLACNTQGSVLLACVHQDHKAWLLSFSKVPALSFISKNPFLSALHSSKQYSRYSMSAVAGSRRSAPAMTSRAYPSPQQNQHGTVIFDTIIADFTGSLPSAASRTSRPLSHPLCDECQSLATTPSDSHLRPPVWAA